MPLEIHETNHPSGLRYLALDIEGRVSLADVRKLEDWLFPGKPHHRGCLLPRLAKGTEFTPEARKFLANLTENCSSAAIVVTSPLVRAAVKLIMRYAADQYDIVRLFATEEAAVAWLESRHRQ